MRVFMPLAAESVFDGTIYPGCPSTAFIHLVEQILLLRYLMNDLNNFDITYRGHSLAPTANCR